MKSYRYELIRKTFGFVDKVVERLNHEEVGDCRWLDAIKIRPADDALMARTPTFDSYTWCGGGHHNYDSFFAVTEDGGEYQLYKLEEEGEAGTGDAGITKYIAGNIGEQLFGWDVWPSFLVEVVQNDKDDDGQGDSSRFMTIYKMAKHDLSAYHRRQIEKGVAELLSELDSVENEPRKKPSAA